MVTIKYSAFKALRLFWGWKCYSCKTPNRLYHSPHRHDHVKCESCGLEFEITDRPETPTQPLGDTWHSDEEMIFSNRYAEVPNFILREQFNRSKNAIQNKARELGVTKSEAGKRRSYLLARKMKGERGDWTSDEDQFIRSSVSRMTTRDIAELLGRSYWSVVGYMYRRNITRRK